MTTYAEETERMIECAKETSEQVLRENGRHANVVITRHPHVTNIFSAVAGDHRHAKHLITDEIAKGALEVIIISEVVFCEFNGKADENNMVSREDLPKEMNHSLMLLHVTPRCETCYLNEIDRSSGKPLPTEWRQMPPSTADETTGELARLFQKAAVRKAETN